MIAMNKVLIPIILLMVSCNIYNTDEVIIDRNLATQKWMYTSDQKEMELIPYDRNKADEANYYIIYDFSDSCQIIHSDRKSNYYQQCYWNLSGNEANLFLTLSYTIKSENNTVQLFRYFYKVLELSEQRFELKYIEQVF